MSADKAAMNSNELSEFIDFLYEGLSGYIYVALREPNNPESWQQKFFNYPLEKNSLVEEVIRSTKDLEVYIAPALFKTSGTANKGNFYATNVVWTEFDGNAPEEASYLNLPSMRVCSSKNGHEHVYWKLNEPITEINIVEEINRSIAYSMGADSSGWDANQVLRPPQTINHKRNEKEEVRVLSVTEFTYDRSNFSNLPAAPELVDADSWNPGSIPDVATVILRYPFSEQAAQLFRADVNKVNQMFPKEKRSGALMQLAYFCCEMKMRDNEIFSILLNADDRWGKFKNRADRNKRLAHIISVARHKHPEEDSASFQALIFDYVSFLNTDIEIDWVVEIPNSDGGMLMEQGTMLFTGPGGVGKTQMSLRWAQNIALGHNYLGYMVQKPRKVLFLSLEMGPPDLKFFLTTMDKTLTKEDREILRENMIIVPHGEPWYLNDPVGQGNLLRIIDDIEPEGIFIDSVGSSTKGSISSEEPITNLMAFNDRLKKNYNLFTWWVHHMRKANGDNKRPESQDDVYGSQYLVNRASSVYALFRSKHSGKLRVRNLKMRMSQEEPEYIVERLNNLAFRRVPLPTGKIDPEVISYKPNDDVKGPNIGPKGANGFSL